MATFTRQELLERFAPLEENTFKTSLPCHSQRPCEPESQDITIDFELILKELDEQEQKKREYQDKKAKHVKKKR